MRVDRPLQPNRLGPAGKTDSKASQPCVLVTGAAGFLGRHTVAALVDQGWHVIAISRQQPPPSPVGPSVRWIQGDVTDIGFMIEALRRVDAICHLAAHIPADHEDVNQVVKCLEVNAAATLRLADLAANQGIRRFVYLSGSNAYKFEGDPKGSGNLSVDENHPLYPTGHGSYYLTSKFAGEVFLEHIRQTCGLPAITLRVSTPYGPQMSPRSIVADFMSSAQSGHGLCVRNGGIATYDFVYVYDVIGVVTQALAGGEPGVYNVGTGQATSVMELAHAVAATFPDRDIPIIVESGDASVSVGTIRFPAIDCSKAARILGFQPRGLKAGLRHYRNQLEQSVQINLPLSPPSPAAIP